MNDWTVRNTETGKEWHVDSRSEGEERIDDVAGLHDPEDFEIIPPNEATQDNPPHDHHGNPVSATDGGTETVQPEVVDQSDTVEPEKTEVVDNSEDEAMMGVDICVHCECEIDDGFCPNCDGNRSSEVEPTEYDLPDKPRVDQDPLTWMPDEFTDTVDGSVCINRKGFEVLCQHFGVSIKPEVEVSPHETDFEYAQCRAVATTEDGTEYVAYGSAHVDRGDDKGVLLEMSDTRSYKRAASRATGVGMLAVEEIQNGVGQ